MHVVAENYEHTHTHRTTTVTIIIKIRLQLYAILKSGVDRASTSRTGRGAGHGCAVPGQGPTRVMDQKVVSVDGPRSCNLQLVIVYLAIPCHHCPVKNQRYCC